jgi:PE family
MSFLMSTPEYLVAASDLANIGSSVNAANAIAAFPTTQVVAAGADEVSASIATMFGAHAQAYRALSAQATTFHNQFVQLTNGGVASYASTEAASAEQNMLNAVNAPAQALLGARRSAPAPVGGRGSQARTAGC